MKPALKILCAGLLLLMVVSIFKALTVTSEELELIVPCHNCSEMQRRHAAMGAAHTLGQKIYVAQGTPSGDFIVDEYLVTQIKPRETLVTLTGIHDVNSELSLELKASQRKISDLINKNTKMSIVLRDGIDLSYAIEGKPSNGNLFLSTDTLTGQFKFDTTFTSAFEIAAMSKSVAESWLSSGHQKRFSAELAKMQSQFLAYIEANEGRMPTILLSEKRIVTYLFSDGTTAEMDLSLTLTLDDKTLNMQLNNSVLKDAKGLVIPENKEALFEYLDAIGKDARSLQTRGSVNAIRTYLSNLFAQLYTEQKSNGDNFICSPIEGQKLSCKF
ncbi:hypothetical protein HG263_03705 [Pseudoalteromonas sp. JBTF-M23]|uniref:Uncharacterized protein n=1 Tax=Pseudoalteromonas caenipelagi TaxID=2726988 RepID=A0A849V9T6_9GAMM|nr:hypothetical protein [Pseudoalteromonas caenipelagi]NOU49648.1 hypothetical protein [Pseudoalteromonas caenipelagi]